MIKVVLSVFIVFYLSETALSKDVFSDTYKFSGTYKFIRTVPNKEPYEGIIYIAEDTFSSQELIKLRAHKWFEEAPKDWLEAEILNKNTCIAFGNQLILSKGFQKNRTSYISRKFQINVYTWIDASYGFVLEVQKNLLKMESYNPKTISAENEKFEIEKLATGNLDECLNQITNTLKFLGK